MIRHRAVLDAVRDAIFLADIDTGMIVDANRAAESLCGRSVAELRSLHHTQLHSPETMERAGRSFLRNVELPSVTEGAVLHKDGHRIPVEVSSSHFTAPDGRRILIGVFRNITERIAAQEELRRSEQRFRQVADIAGEFIWELDAEGLYVYASPVVEQVLGYHPEEIVGKMHFYDLLVPETRAETKAAWFERFARRDPFRAFPNKKVRKDGRIVALESSGAPIRDTNGNFLGYRGASEDVTERKQAEEALRQSEKIYRAIGESIDYGVWVCAPDGRNTYTSESFLKLVGLTQEQCSSFGWADVLHPDEAERTIAAWKECVRTQGRWDEEYRLHGADGRWHPVLARGVPVRDAQGRITCWAGINLDIGALKRAQESLRQSESQARGRAVALQAIMDAAPAVILIANDSQCNNISGNHLAHILLRRPPGSNFSKSAPQPERPMNFRLLCDGVEVPAQELPIHRAAFSGQPVRNWEVTAAFEDGSSIHLLGNVEPMFDGNGCPQGAVAVLSDITERKQAEAALRESEERFRDMADTAPVMIWISGQDNLCTFVNKHWLDFTGHTLEQEMGHGWAAGIHPDDLNRCLAIASSSFDARRSFHLEYRMRRADGTYRWLLDSAVPHYRDGEFTGFIGSCVDVTDQKAIEERLRASEVQLMDAQRLAKVGSWERDLATGTEHWSDEMFRIYGLTKDAAPSFPALLSHVHPKDRQVILTADHQLRAKIAPLRVEYRIIRPDGEVRCVRSIVESIQNDRGELVRVVGATQDITDQVRATELLRESEERLKSAERLAHVGHWDWDLKTNQVSWSREILQILGQPEGFKPSVEGFFQIVAPQEGDRARQWVRDCLANKRGSSIEVTVTRPDGDLRTLSLISEVVLDEEGLPVRMFGSCQDFTESRRAQDEAFARQKLESLGTLASGIAHDFNNLLGGVLAQAELALAELAAGSHPEEELKRIRQVAIHGAEIVRQLMFYAGKESEVLELVDVSHIVREILDLLRVSVPRSALLQTDLSSNLPAVEANGAQLRQIVMNLVTNASEAVGEQGGIIRVATSLVTVGRATAFSQDVAEGDYLELEVSDTGSGMSQETKARVFDPFFTTKSAGRGLGLAVVHGIVRNLRGAIHFTSELGKGTTFRILLPSAESGAGAAAGPIPHDEEPARASHDATVLIVEDEDPLRLAVAKMLRKRGFDVLEAADGSAAIDLLHANRANIDLILLDVTIPGRSSQEVIAEAAQAGLGLKVILTSAYSREMVASGMSAPLIHGFIRKPFRLDDVVQTLRNALSS